MWFPNWKPLDSSPEFPEGNYVLSIETIQEVIMSARNLRTSKEKNLFAISFGISLIAWIILVVTIIGIFYGMFFGLFLFVAHALMISHIKGHGVKLSGKAVSWAL